MKGSSEAICFQPLVTGLGSQASQRDGSAEESGDPNPGGLASGMGRMFPSTMLSLAPVWGIISGSTGGKPTQEDGAPHRDPGSLLCQQPAAS